MARVLVIGDTHAPCMHRRYLRFLLDTYEAWECDTVVHIGDLVDNCALSFHLKPPKLKNPIAEYRQAMKQVRALTEAFPEATLLLGNHDVLPYRWAEEVGIPDEMLRNFSEIFHLPSTWKVIERYGQLKLDGVLYQHGDRGKGGQMAAAKNAKEEFRSVVQGHHHSQAGVVWHANRSARCFGLQVGCGADWQHIQQAYGRKYSAKPILGCGIVLDGETAVFEPLLL